MMSTACPRWRRSSAAATVGPSALRSDTYARGLRPLVASDIRTLSDPSPRLRPGESDQWANRGAGYA